MIHFTVLSQIELGLYADKITLLGDGEYNKIGTLDIKATMDWRSDLETHSFALKTQYEYADLYGGYYSRLTVGLGAYIPINDFEIGGFANIGTIKRKDVETPLTYSFLGEFNYKLNNHWSVSAQLEWVYRTDLVILWDEQSPWKPNALIGIKYTFKDNWKRQ